MTSEEIKGHIKFEFDAAVGANFEATREHCRNVALLEIAYQIAVLNERKSAAVCANCSKKLLPDFKLDAHGKLR